MILPTPAIQLLDLIPANLQDKARTKIERILQDAYKDGYAVGVEAGITMMEQDNVSDPI